MKGLRVDLYAPVVSFRDPVRNSTMIRCLFLLHNPAGNGRAAWEKF